MSWNQNGQQNGQQNGNGQQRQPPKIPELGKGRVYVNDKSRAKDASVAPDFTGMINVDGHIIRLSLWYNPAKPGTNGGMMKESFNVKGQTYDPSQHPSQQPAQQGYAPQPQYAPPPQNGGYTPAPGYTPPAPPPQTAPPPAQGGWGGRPQQGQQQQRALSPGDPPF